MLKSTGKMKEMFDGICFCEFGRPSFSIDLSTSRSNEEIESKGAQDVSVEISAYWLRLLRPLDAEFV